METITRKERPILMGAPMALATRNGTKTETRRMINPNEPEIISQLVHITAGHESARRKEELIRVHCPYGQIGDVLWIREPYYAYGYWQQVKKKNGKMGYQFIEEKENLPAKYFEYQYTDNPPTEVLTKKDTDSHGWYKRLARFMPKAACRTRVEIVGLKVERLNDITEESTIAEGIINVYQLDQDHEPEYQNYLYDGKTSHWDVLADSALHSFQTLWESINGSNSWTENPFVWVVQFKILPDASSTLP